MRFKYIDKTGSKGGKLSLENTERRGCEISNHIPIDNNENASAFEANNELENRDRSRRKRSFDEIDELEDDTEESQEDLDEEWKSDGSGISRSKFRRRSNNHDEMENTEKNICHDLLHNVPVRLTSEVQNHRPTLESDSVVQSFVKKDNWRFKNTKKVPTLLNTSGKGLTASDLGVNSKFMEMIEKSPHFAGVNSRGIKTEYFVQLENSECRYLNDEMEGLIKLVYYWQAQHPSHPNMKTDVSINS